MAVTIDDVRGGVRRLGLGGRPLGVHASLRSFGWVDGGAAAVVAGLRAEDCTVLVPTFSWEAFAVDPLPDQQPARNGADYVPAPRRRPGTGRIYTPDTTELDRAEMGALPAALLAMLGRVRGCHPLCSFTAVGPLAAALVGRQTPLDVFGPLAALAEAGGAVVLMGVDLTSLTLLHLAERRAGRVLFRRWANGKDGQPMMVEVGGCSDGFDRFAPLLAPLAVETTVGASVWRAFPAAAVLERAAAAIHADPAITHCGVSGCRCDDAVAGGPILRADG